MTKDDAIRLVRAYADIVPPDDHIRTMPDRMADHSIGKAMRWLGYVQGVLVERGVFSLDEIKEHSRMFSSDPNVKSLTPTEQHTLWFYGDAITLRIKSGPLK